MINFKDYQWVFEAKPQPLLARLETMAMEEFGYSPESYVVGSLFTYIKGDVPVMLVAHVDTVFKTPPQLFIYDQESNIVTSPDGLGADDRAGVVAILEILKAGLRPHILLCDLEESGGKGATDATKKLEVPEVKFIIELDRAGENDMVFYSCDNQKFTKYIKSFGFTKAYGSFTDISILCPAWGIAGVNLSVGYRHQHSEREYLNLNHLETTIGRIKQIFKNIPKRIFKYEKAKYSYFDYSPGQRNACWSNGFCYDSWLNGHSLDEYYDKYVSTEATKNTAEVKQLPQDTADKHCSLEDIDKESADDFTLLLAITAEDLYNNTDFGSMKNWDNFLRDNADDLLCVAEGFVIDAILEYYERHYSGCDRYGAVMED